MQLLVTENCHGDDQRRGVMMYGSYVTERFHEEVSALMSANRLGDPAYEARQKCHAFFQGGSNDPKGKFIFIEFLTSKGEECWADFMKLLNQAYRKVRVPELESIRIAANTPGCYGYVTMIREDTKCPFDAGDSMTPMYFRPESNVQHNEVFKLAKYVELNVTV